MSRSFSAARSSRQRARRDFQFHGFRVLFHRWPAPAAAPPATNAAPFRNERRPTVPSAFMMAARFSPEFPIRIPPAQLSMTTMGSRSAIKCRSKYLFRVKFREILGGHRRQEPAWVPKLTISPRSRSSRHETGTDAVKQLAFQCREEAPTERVVPRIKPRDKLGNRPPSLYKGAHRRRGSGRSRRSSYTTIPDRGGSQLDSDAD